MTREKAIEWIKFHIDITPYEDTDELKIALNMAIKALEKEPTKNDLGVDWESYKDADGNSLDYLILNVLQNNFDCGDAYGYTVADKIISLLPSVTPQEPFKPMVEIDLYSVIKQKYIEREVLNKIREQIKSNLRGVEIALEVLVENHPLRPKMEGAKDTLEECLEIIDKYKAETEDQE